MTQDKTNAIHYIADEGKVFRRIADQVVFGSEIYLGYTYYIGGVKLSEPKLEVIEDFEEVEDENKKIKE